MVTCCCLSLPDLPLSIFLGLAIGGAFPVPIEGRPVVAETEFVRAVSRATKQVQDVPAHWLDLAAAGVEPFNDFEPLGSTTPAPAASTLKEK